MAEDEGDEEGDHGSIVAFRIPCSPSVDFQPPCPPAFYTPASPRGRLLQPADLHPLATRLLLSCPPFLSPILRALPLSRPRLSVPVIPWPPLSSALPPPLPCPLPPAHLCAVPCDSHETINPRPPSRTCTVDVHASLRRPRPVDQTLYPPLSSPSRSPVTCVPLLFPSLSFPRPRGFIPAHRSRSLICTRI
jgi:hypothetical protein